MKQLVERAIIE